MSLPPEWVGVLEHFAAERDARRHEHAEWACPHEHRGPEGPNEDVGHCAGCGTLAFTRRPEGEEFGGHAPDCSLPREHPSYCAGGGAGHPPPRVMRG